MNLNKISFTSALLTAAMVSAARPVADSCCRVYSQQGFRGKGRDYCIENDERSSPQMLQDAIGGKNRVRSVQCGIKVDATICPNGYQIKWADPFKAEYICEDGDKGQSFGALEQIDDVEFDKKRASIIINHHPWVAKGPHYLSLTREEKADILWEKITESDQMGEYHADKFFDQDMKSVFDEEGDEFDCRVKTIHSTGNVAKVYWVSDENHDYTGIFKGGDSGFARLSDSTSQVVKPGETRIEPFTNTGVKMLPAIAVKILRDGIDSANTFGSAGFNGQDSYNFFKSLLFSAGTVDAVGNPEGPPGGAFDFSFFGENIRPETYFTTSVGNSNLAEYDQWGVKEENVKFPFNLAFRPTGEFNRSFPDDTYDVPMEEYFQTIQAGETLYDIYAQEMPGEEYQKVGKLVLASRLVTSLWGDNHMFFRHQRLDDDLRNYRPEWTSFYPQSFEEDKEFDRVRPEASKADVYCPFAFLFH